MDHGLAALSKPPIAPTAQRTAARGTHAVPGAASAGPISQYDGAIQTANRVSSVTGMAFLPMMAAMPALLLGKGAKMLGRERTAAVLGGVGDAALHGVRRTPLNNPMQLGKDVVGTMADHAEAIGGRAAPMAASLRHTSDRLGVLGERAATAIGKVAQPLLAPLGKGLERVGAAKPLATAWSRVGKFPLFAGVALVAASAGIAATWLNRAKQSEQGKLALQELTALAGADSAVVKQASTLYTKQQSRSMIAATFQSLSASSMVPFEANLIHGGKAMAIMMFGPQVLDSVATLVVPENPTLNAFSVLRAEERGQMKLTPEVRAFQFRQLLGTVPAVQQHGGSRNVLATAIADDMAEKKLTVADYFALVNDTAKFNDYATQVQHRVQTKAPATGEVKASPVAEKPAPMLATAPVVDKANLAHEGRVAHAERVRA